MTKQDQPDLPHQPSFSGISTFGRLPYIEDPAGTAIDLAILGIPYDSLVTSRPGARLGPKAIRAAAMRCRNYSLQMDVGVFKLLRCVDVGDVGVNIFNFEETFQRIQKKIDGLMQQETAVVSLGGDHSILIPILRAVRQVHEGLTLIQFDAHTDTSDEAYGQKYHHGTCVRRAIEEGLVQGRRIFQIGIRGTLASVDYLDFARQEGINILDMPGFHDRANREAFLARIRETAGGGPCYLTFDVDGIDPAFAPGTGTPVIGGLTSFEAINTMRALRGLNFIGGDVMEVAPPYDSSEITSLLGASLAYEIAALIAVARMD